MDNRFNEISVKNIWGGDLFTLADKITVSDNLSIEDYTPFSTVKDKVIMKNMQYTQVLLAFVCMKGSVDMEVDFKRYILNAGDTIVITHKQVGELYNISDDFRYFLVVINDTFYDPNINSSDPNRNKTLLDKLPFVHLSDKALEESVSLFNILKGKLQEKTHSYRLETIRGLIHAFFFNIFSQIAKKEDPKPLVDASSTDSRQKEVFSSFLKAVGEHYTIERNIKYYADILCITPKYLSQIIYQVSGRFAGDYIRDYVVREAKALIRGKRYSMLDISVMLNFSTQSSFTRFFKNATGMSPLEYQNNC